MNATANLNTPASMWTIARSSTAVSVQLVIAAISAFALHALAAATFGAGPALDAYYLGAAVPTVIVAAFTAGLVFIVAPLVRDSRGGSDAERAAMPAASLVVVGGFSLVLAAAASVLATPIVGVLGAGLDASVRPSAARVLAIQAWSPVLVAIAVWLSAHLVTSGRPALASGGTAVGNTLAAATFVVTRGYGDVTWIAWSVLGGAAAQLLFVLGALRIARQPVTRPVATRRATRQAAYLVLPWLAAATLYKSHAVIDRVVASWDDSGGVTALALGLTLVTVAASSLTRGIGLALSPRLGAGAASAARDLWNGIRAGLLLLAPAVVLLVALRGELVALLFGYGSFNTRDVSATAATLIPYSVALLALGMGNVITTTFYALGDTRTPALVGIAGLFVHATVTFALWPIAGYLAAAWGFAAMSASSLAVLLLLLHRRIGPMARREDLATALRPVVLAVALLPVLIGVRAGLLTLVDPGRGSAALVVATATFPYLVAYFVAAALPRRAPVDPA
jgi:putative peptidoglycan lipid II flippase